MFGSYEPIGNIQVFADEVVTVMRREDTLPWDVEDGIRKYLDKLQGKALLEELVEIQRRTYARTNVRPKKGQRSLWWQLMEDGPDGSRFKVIMRDLGRISDRKKEIADRPKVTHVGPPDPAITKMFERRRAQQAPVVAPVV
jgi:hypothetical protein